MPISKREFERGKLVAEEDKAIQDFLGQRTDTAFSEAEIVEEMAKAFGVLLGADILEDMQFREGITDALRALVKDGRVERKRIGFTVYYSIAQKKRRKRPRQSGGVRIG